MRINFNEFVRKNRKKIREILQKQDGNHIATSKDDEWFEEDEWDNYYEEIANQNHTCIKKPEKT